MNFFYAKWTLFFHVSYIYNMISICMYTLNLLLTSIYLKMGSGIIFFRLMSDNPSTNLFYSLY